MFLLMGLTAKLGLLKEAIILINLIYKLVTFFKQTKAHTKVIIRPNPVTSVVSRFISSNKYTKD